MKIIFTLLVFIVSISYGSNPTDSQWKKNGYETLDMSEYSKTQQPTTQKISHNVKIDTTCVDKFGKTLKAGDTEYTSCLADSVNSKDYNTNHFSNTQRGPSVNISVDSN